MRGSGGTSFRWWIIPLSIACGAEPAGSPALVSGPGITEVFSASLSGLREPRRAVISEESEWISLWQAIHPDANPPPRPEVNFGEQIVIVAALGERPTGGFAIRIDSVRSSDTGRQVFVTTTKPGTTCMTTQVLTQPVHIVTAPVAGGSTRFVEAETTKDCE
jgi:protease stability complex PrcB-like protein